MLDLVQKIFLKRISEKQNRNYDFQILKLDAHHQQLKEKGYIHLQNILSNNEINQLLNIYNQINKSKKFEETDYFVNSVSFKSSELKSFTTNSVAEIIKPVLPKFLYPDKIRFPVSVGFCINPAQSSSGSRPHQDPNLVDETHSYSLVLWISLCDMSIENGCLHVLEGSHLWGNYIRSNFHVRWRFDDFVDELLWKNMKAIETKAGDIICFDAALIHGSTPNKTNKNRLAIQLSTIPKNQDLITVIEKRKGIFDYAQFHNIDESYFTVENVCNIPSNKFAILKEEKINYYYTKEDVIRLLNDN